MLEATANRFAATSALAQSLGTVSSGVFLITSIRSGHSVLLAAFLLGWTLQGAIMTTFIRGSLIRVHALNADFSAQFLSREIFICLAVVAGALVLCFQILSGVSATYFVICAAPMMLQTTYELVGQAALALRQNRVLLLGSLTRFSGSVTVFLVASWKEWSLPQICLAQAAIFAIAMSFLIPSFVKEFHKKDKVFPNLRVPRHEPTQTKLMRASAAIGPGGFFFWVIVVRALFGESLQSLAIVSMSIFAPLSSIVSVFAPILKARSWQGRSGSGALYIEDLMILAPSVAGVIGFFLPTWFGQTVFGAVWADIRTSMLVIGVGVSAQMLLEKLLTGLIMQNRVATVIAMRITRWCFVFAATVCCSFVSISLFPLMLFVSFASVLFTALTFSSPALRLGAADLSRDWEATVSEN